MTNGDQIPMTQSDRQTWIHSAINVYSRLIFSIASMLTSGFVWIRKTALLLVILIGSLLAIAGAQIVVLDLSSRLGIFPLKGFFVLNGLIVTALTLFVAFNGRLEIPVFDFGLNGFRARLRSLFGVNTPNPTPSGASARPVQKKSIAVMMIIRRDSSEERKAQSVSA